MFATRTLAAALAVCQALLATTAVADEFDDLRLKWRNTIVGTGYDPTDSLVASKLSSIASSANSVWNSMEKSALRSTLWQDAASTTNSADITTSYNRLRSMALAHATPGCSLYQNASLLTDTIGALDWMHANPHFPALRSAPGSSNGLHPKSKFLAFIPALRCLRAGQGKDRSPRRLGTS